MEITVNGNLLPLKGSPNLSALLDSMGIEATRTVVELNGEIIERARLEEVTVNPGDKIEIVRFVGGG